MRALLGTWGAPLGIVFLAGWALVGQGVTPTALHAEASPSADSDQDGLPDRQEQILGTDPFLPDSDFDGYSDGEEFAIGTYPTLFEDVPSGTEGLSMAISARGEAGKLKVFIAIHNTVGNLSDQVLRFGLYAGGRTVDLSTARVLAHSQTVVLSAPNGGKLFTLDLEMPEGVVHLYGGATFYGVVGLPGRVRYAAAAKIDLLVKEGIILLRRELPERPGNDPLLVGGGGNTIHQPIPPGGDGGIPADWEAEQVCLQSSEVVGTTGSVVLNQVTSATCEDGWDSYCSTDCAASVGETFQTIDTGALLGG